MTKSQKKQARRAAALAAVPGMTPTPKADTSTDKPLTGHAVGITERAEVKLYSIDCGRCGAVATLVAKVHEQIRPVFCPECGLREEWTEIVGEHNSFRVITKPPTLDELNRMAIEEQAEREGVDLHPDRPRDDDDQADADLARELEADSETDDPGANDS